jgi:DNA-binding NtrC family response regulator
MEALARSTVGSARSRSRRTSPLYGSQDGQPGARVDVRGTIDAAWGAPATELLPGLVGASSPMRRLADEVHRLSSFDWPVLVRGESGTGKELVARAIHRLGKRARGPFVAINAAALTRELAGSELFGHKRGAFTGASEERRGALREAHGGTLLLDEVGAMPLCVQAQLLRALETRELRPVGHDLCISVDVRVVAATCEPLEELVAEGRFRADLYERLASWVLRVPALRERPSDVPALVARLLREAKLTHVRVSSTGARMLSSLPWPGNVRQLRNVLLQAALLSDGLVHAEHVALALAARGADVPTPPRPSPADALALWESCGRNMARAARTLGLPRTSLRDLVVRAQVSAAPSAAPRGEPCSAR